MNYCYGQTLYIVLPYDILFTREVVHNAIYGKREAKQIYMEELGNLAGQIVCTTTEQAEFIRRLLEVIEKIWITKSWALR